MKVSLLSNQGQIGGGEVMLFAVAEALRSLGHEPTVVGPSHHPDVLIQARQKGFEYAGIPSHGRADYLVKLRSWSQRAQGDLLWANGFLPATATSGLSQRIVHLHQVPSGRLQPLVTAALHGATAVIAPSRWVAERIPGAEAVPNWTADIGSELPSARLERRSQSLRVGFLGRLTRDKGILDLLAAIDRFRTSVTTIPIQLHIGGVTRFSSRREEHLITTSIANCAVPVHQWGWVDRATFLHHVDVLVVPSNWGEAFGLVAAEAMSAGTPVITSDDAALPEVVGSNYPFIFQAGNVDQLTEALNHFSTLYAEDTAESTVHRNRQRWEALFSPSAGESRVDSLISRVEGLM